MMRRHHWIKPRSLDLEASLRLHNFKNPTLDRRSVVSGQGIIGNLNGCLSIVTEFGET
jgi:hypothetical protein